MSHIILLECFTCGNLQDNVGPIYTRKISRNDLHAVLLSMGAYKWAGRMILEIRGINKRPSPHSLRRLEAFTWTPNIWYNWQSDDLTSHYTFDCVHAATYYLHCMIKSLSHRDSLSPDLNQPNIRHGTFLLPGLWPKSDLPSKYWESKNSWCHAFGTWTASRYLHSNDGDCDHE